MSIVIDGTLGVSLVQDGIITESKIATGAVTESKIVSGAVTDTKLTLTPNSQEIKDALNATGSAPIYACRAWVNFNGTGTVAIRASGNVSSITDNAVGEYTVNLTTAMPDENYAIAGSGYGANAISSYGLGNPKTTSSVHISATLTTTGATCDPAIVDLAFFR